jgi:hypothetical protein
MLACAIALTAEAGGISSRCNALFAGPRGFRFAFPNLRWLPPPWCSFCVAVLGFNLRYRTFFKAAGQDHITDVVLKTPKAGWLTTQPAIREYLAGHLGMDDGIQRFTLPGYRLVKVRGCRLSGELWVHLVYEDGSHDFSVYVRPQSRTLVDRLLTASWPKPIHSRFEMGLEVTQGDSSAFTIFVVGAMPRGQTQMLTTRVLTSLLS